MTQLIGTCLMFALWQSTLILAAALFVGRYFRKTPWQSHDLHLFGIIAAVLAPMFSTVIAVQNAGWFANGRWSDVFLPLANWSSVFGVLLLIGMILFAALLIWGIVASRKLMFRAKPFPDRESQEALLRSAETLQNVSLPILFTSQNVKSPTVWCWGLHPAVVLPEALAESIPAEERDAIFLHELAHITRRDHLTALLTRICGIFLFWNPLYWLALRQTDLLADEACDLLVLSRGNVSPETYTETLLRLAAGECYKPAFQFLSRKEKIMKRITTILDFGDLPTKPSVKPSRLWQCSALVVALLLCVTLAFCQEKREVVTDQDGKFTLPNQHNNAPLEGTVTMDGKPLAGATVTFAPNAGVINQSETSVEGIITMDGLPLADATVMFSPADESKEFCAGIADVNGKYSLRSQSGKMNDIQPGEYSVFIGKKVFEDGKVQSVVDAKYADPKTTRLAVTVKEGKNTFDFGLVSGNGAQQNSGRVARELLPAQKNMEEVPTSLKGFFSKELLESKELKWYPVNKKIADFSADAIDLSTPEAAYATQKNLIVSLQDNKRELLDKTKFWPSLLPTVRSNAGLTEEDAKRYREDSFVFEVFVVNDKQAFVFGFEESTRMYGGYYFIKQDGQWLSGANAIATRDAREIAKRVEGVLNYSILIIKVEPTIRPVGAEIANTDEVTEFRVTFSRDMNTSNYSWDVIGEGKYPETTGEARWIDKRTCVLPVKLQPGTNYALGLTAHSIDGGMDTKAHFIFKTKPANGAEEVTTSLKDFFSKELLESKELKWYPVNKKIADYPADDIDLSTPEKSYATQKNLIVSKRDDKFEQISNMTVGRPKISERERRGMEGFTEEWGKTYREEFVVFEVFVLNDKHAFVFGLRKFDRLYDGNFFLKQGDQWLNTGNEQEMDAKEIAKNVGKIFGARAEALQKVEEKLGNKLDTPQVVKTEPANGADDVDPDAVTELRVTFDRDMNTSSYAWCGPPILFPEPRGEAKWIDKRTCIAPVKLEPGRQYMFMINSAEDRDFKSTEGVPVVPVVYTFKTKTK